MPGTCLDALRPITIRPRSILQPSLSGAHGRRLPDSRISRLMSRRCELTGKGPQVGHKVSHSNIKTKRRFLPNLFNVTLMSDALGRSVRLRISANALKTVDHRGGLDAFLAKAKDDELSPKALDIKREIAKKLRRGLSLFRPFRAHAMAQRASVALALLVIERIASLAAR